MLRGIRISQSRQYAHSRQMGRMVRAATGRVSRPPSTTDAEASCDTLAMELASLKERLVHQADELRRLKKAPTANASTQAMESDLIDKNARLQIEVESLNERIHAMDKLKDDRDTENMKLARQIKHLTAERDADMTKMSTIESKIRELSKQRESLSELSASMITYANEMDELESSMKSIADDAKRKEDYHTKQMLDLASDKERLDSTIKGLERSLHAEKARGSSDTTRLQDEIRTHTESRRALELQVEELQVKLKDIKLDHENSLRRLNSAFLKLARKWARDSKREQEKLVRRIKAESQAAKEADDEQKRKLGEEKRILRDDLEGSRALNAESMHTIAAQQKRIEELDREISSLNVSNSECVKQKATLESRIQKIDARINELSDLLDADDRSRKEAEGLLRQKEQTALQNESDSITEIRELRRKQSELGVQITDNETTITELRSEINRHKKNKDTTDLEHKGQLQSKDGEITRLRDVIKASEALVDKNKGEMKIIQKKVADLEARNAEAEAKHHVSVTNHNGTIKRLENELTAARTENIKLAGTIASNTEKLRYLEEQRHGLLSKEASYVQTLEEKDATIQNARSNIEGMERTLRDLRSRLSEQESSDKRRVSALEERISELAKQLDAEKQKKSDEKELFNTKLQELEEIIGRKQQATAHVTEYETPTKQSKVDFKNMNEKELADLVKSDNNLVKEKAELQIELRAVKAKRELVSPTKSSGRELKEEQRADNVRAAMKSSNRMQLDACNIELKKLEETIKQCESDLARTRDTVKEKESIIKALSEQIETGNLEHEIQISHMEEKIQQLEMHLSIVNDDLQTVRSLLVKSNEDAQEMRQQIEYTEKTFKDHIARMRQQNEEQAGVLLEQRNKLAESTEKAAQFRSGLCTANEDDGDCIDRILGQKKRIDWLKESVIREANTNGDLSEQITRLKQELRNLSEAGSLNKKNIEDFTKLCDEKKDPGDCIEYLKELLRAMNTIKQRVGGSKESDSPSALLLSAVESDVKLRTDEIQSKLDEATAAYTAKHTKDDDTIREMTDTITELKKESGKIADLHRQMHILTEQNNAATSELSRLNLNLETKITENDRLARNIERIQNESDFDRDRISGLTGSNNKLVGTISDLHSLISQKEEEMTQLDSTIISMQQSLKDKQFDIDRLQSKLDKRELEIDASLGNIIASYIDRALRFRAREINTLINNAANLDEQLRNQIVTKFKELKDQVFAILDDTTQGPVPAQKANSLRIILTGIHKNVINDVFTQAQRSTGAPQNRRATGLEAHSQSTSSVHSAKSTSASPAKKAADKKKTTASSSMRAMLESVLNSILDPSWVLRIPDLIKLKRFVDTYRISETDQVLLSLRAAYIEEPSDEVRASIYEDLEKDIANIRNDDPVHGIRDERSRVVGELEEYIKATQTYRDNTISKEDLLRAMEYDDPAHSDTRETIDLTQIEDYVTSVSALSRAKLGSEAKRNLKALLISTHLLSVTTEQGDGADTLVEKTRLEEALRNAISNERVVHDIDETLIEQIKDGAIDDRSDHGNLKREIIKLIDQCSSSDAASALQLPVGVFGSQSAVNPKKCQPRPASAPLVRSRYGSYI
jgi:chromosome segregation ATPase